MRSALSVDHFHAQAKAVCTLHGRAEIMFNDVCAAAPLPAFSPAGSAGKSNQALMAAPFAERQCRSGSTNISNKVVAQLSQMGAI
jgi:hypothetical protein